MSAIPRPLGLKVMLAPLVFILCAGGLSTWLTISLSAREFRFDLLQHARLVAKALDVDRVKALTGVTADLEKVEYRVLKEELTAARSAKAQCRFVYLMGRKADGTFFYFVDSEAPTSKDYSPPGQAFDEPTADFIRVFDTKAETVEGPVSDQWGRWISALVPVTDPRSGAVVAVLGMDIDAHDWERKLAVRAMVPLGLMLMLLIGEIVFCTRSRQNA